MSKLYGLSEADLRMLKSIVSWYKAGGGGKSGRPTSTRRRRSSAAGSPPRLFGMVVSDIPAAGFNGEEKRIEAGKQAEPGVVVLTRETDGLVEDEGIGSLKGWNDCTQSTVRGSVDEPTILPGRIEVIEGETYFVVEQFDLRSLAGYEKGTDKDDDAQAPYHEGDSGEFKLGREDCGSEESGGDDGTDTTGPTGNWNTTNITGPNDPLIGPSS